MFWYEGRRWCPILRSFNKSVALLIYECDRMLLKICTKGRKTATPKSQVPTSIILQLIVLKDTAVKMYWAVNNKRDAAHQRNTGSEVCLCEYDFSVKHCYRRRIVGKKKSHTMLQTFCCNWQLTAWFHPRISLLPSGTYSWRSKSFLQTVCHVYFPLASTASLREPARRKKAAECWNLCFPNREKAFLSAAFLHRSSLKLLRKKSVILAFFWDLQRKTTWIQQYWCCKSSVILHN